MVGGVQDRRRRDNGHNQNNDCCMWLHLFRSSTKGVLGLEYVVDIVVAQGWWWWELDGRVP